jgi:large subunit ribosomal protein L20
VKKRIFRQDWQRTISGALAKQDLNYSRLINGLKKQNIQIDRKILSQLAKNHPATFQEIVEKAK